MPKTLVSPVIRKIFSIRSFSALGLIDPISNLAHRNIYVYHGLADEVVSAPVADEGAEFYEHFGANVQYNSTSLAGHSWVSPLGLRGSRTRPLVLTSALMRPARTR